MALKVLRAFRSYEAVGGEVLEGRRVMDFYSYAAINIVARNPPLAPSVEVRGGYLEALALEPTLISAGGMGRLTIDGREVPMWNAYLVGRSALVRLEAREDSVAYLTVHGGVAVEVGPVSRGSRLDPMNPTYTLKELRELLPALHLPERYVPGEARVLEFVPPWGAWTGDGCLDRLTLAKKTPESGYLLVPAREPPELGYPEEGPFRPGSLALMAREGILVPLSFVEGSFLKLGELTPHSMDSLARLRPNTPVGLKPLDTREGEGRFKEYLSKLSRIERVISAAIEAVMRGARRLKIKVKGKLYEVWIEELK